MYGKDVLGGNPAWWNIGFLGKAPATGSTLLNGLVSYWTMNEASGSRADSVGSYTLNSVNSVVSRAGKNGNAADLVRVGTKYLASANASITLPASYSFSLWAKNDADATAIIGNLLSVDFDDSIYQARLLAGSNYSFACTDAGPSSVSNSFITNPNDNAWHHLVCTYDSTTMKTGIYLNGIAGTAGSALGDVRETAGRPLWFGRGLSGESYFDGGIDEVGLWNRVLTSAEAAELYNSAAGKFYPF